MVGWYGVGGGRGGSIGEVGEVQPGAAPQIWVRCSIGEQINSE